MKAYGKTRSEVPTRFRMYPLGTHVPCPCCRPTGSFHGITFKKRARQEAKKFIRSEVV